jgi:glucose-1-phosphate thymidylyltransferase
MKGIILAGGTGARLYPLTFVTSKQLLPVYNKPMIYYPLSTLMLAGIQDILIISTPRDLPHFQSLFGNGDKLGINLSYEEQPMPEGIAQALLIGEKFISQESCALILGDNIFYGTGLNALLRDIVRKNNGATIFGYHVVRPEKYGVIEFDDKNKIISIEEKPKVPKSNYAIPGLYFYDKHVCEYTKELKPSSRNELEITDLNYIYLKNNQLDVKILGRGYTWFDVGTHEDLFEASHFIKIIEEHQDLIIASPEEIAYRNGWIDASRLLSVAGKYGKLKYRQYLEELLKGEKISNECS